MFYSFALTVPAGTTEAAPVVTRLKLTAGIIHQVDVEFRSGTDFRVGVRINQGLHQVYPTNPDGELKADGRPIIFPDYYRLDPGEDELVVYAYAPTATYEHVVYIKIGVLTADELRPMTTVDNLLMRFLRLVGVVK
jgi:hypothetical protein